MIELLTDPAVWLAFLTLTLLEIVLGIDNIIFLSILVSKLPKELQPRGRIIGLAFAMVTRIGLLFSITWLIRLTAPLITILGEEISGRDLILFAGGLFLLVKSVSEIHGALEGAEHPHGPAVKLKSSVMAVAVQIGLVDIVFSFDSVLTAVGLAEHIEVMVAAIVIAVFVMMFLARPIHEFIERHPTIKMLALAFLILIGVALIAEALDFEIPKGYLYFAMAFSVGVEMINIRLRRRVEPVVDLRGPELPDSKPPKH
ncbi:MAG TPA: TerC family protein [Steroidobacteraceae bacterium]|nr:TerC family protein [Steroidobacteraceae bacterium]